MTDTVDSERLALLVAARAATQGGLEAVPRIVSALRRYAPPTVDGSGWARLVGAAALTSADVGSAVTTLLGGRVDTTWPALTERYLPMIALGAATTTRLKDRNAWTAAIAARLLGLWTDGAPPSLSAVCDAFAWNQIGLPGRPKRCPPEVRAHFLGRELQIDDSRPDRLLRLYVARELGAKRSELRELRDALVRRWLANETVQPDFVDAVRAATDRTTAGWFDDRKLFIASAWSTLTATAPWRALSLDDFKTRLVAAHRARTLVLARADLVAAMDPHLVAASETLAAGATFHFIVKESP